MAVSVCFLCCGFSRAAHHFRPALGVDGEKLGPKRCHRADGARHRVRDVVELEVEEDGQASVCHTFETVRAVCAEKLKPELDAAHAALERFGKRTRLRHINGIKRAVDAATGFQGLGHGHIPSSPGMSPGLALFAPFWQGFGGAAHGFVGPCRLRLVHIFRQ